MQPKLEKSCGFTLVELLIAVAIVGILATVALPAWNDQVLKSRRADARNALLLAQIEQEKYRANHLSYATSMSDIGLASYTSTSRDYYWLKVENASATTFVISATPTDNQANDTDCGTFAISETGPYYTTPYAGASCW